MNSIYDSRILNLVIFFPLLVAGVIALLPKGEKGQIRALTFAGMIGSLLTTVWAWLRFDSKSPVEFQLEYRLEWLSDVGVSYHVGVDGLGIALVLLTGVLGPLVVLSSWTFVDERVKDFHIALLVLQTATFGAFCAIDSLLFFMFFEAVLIPMYLLIGVWGSEERQKAAVKFFLYTMVGSVLMLLALFAVYFLAAPAGSRSFDYSTMYNGMLSASRELAAYLKANPSGDGAGLTPTALALFKYGPWLFLAFALAFAIKVPMFPLHTWLPDAHVQAPVAGSMMLAGVMLKLGTYGFWRFAIPLFPVQARQYQTFFAVLAVIGIVYGALMCLAQRDIKKLIAYSSVSHLGYCMLGIFAFTVEGATGSAYQMLNHGVSTGALFLLFGFMYERRHARLMSDYGGLAKVVPVYTAFFLIVTFSSIAVPGTNGFVGEFLVLLGTIKSNLPLGFGVIAATAVVLGAAYMLWMVQKVFFGQITHQENHALKDLSGRELAAAIPFLVMIVVMGLRPQPFLDVLNPASERFVARANYAAGGNDDSRVRVGVRELPKALAQVAPQQAVPQPLQPNRPELVRPSRPMIIKPAQPQLLPANP
ncbi:MAG: Fe-S-binding domain-containing protein [Archangium gephyra]|uniref:Fe-S-binding domain-containing protein n=1 Tax=Archangium gephyra TaxID=48 RepID=A0A2W5U1Q2_9BACT|nr:MAG: Fe-S-binding domain-containing protein [Archangium gephyra]